MNFSVEEITNESFLYYRVHKSYVREGQILPGVFRELGEGEDKGMSTDWDKYSTAEQSKQRARNPNDNGIVQGLVEFIRGCNLPVVHYPYEDNQAHTNVKDLGEGLQLTAKRKKLADIFSTWVIDLEM